ncbi:hypothetical protein Hanom_Chr00s121762g01811941 [Helianthus anomalus]
MFVPTRVNSVGTLISDIKLIAFVIYKIMHILQKDVSVAYLASMPRFSSRTRSV